MDKKDIYEHLAKIYLDASSKKKTPSPKYPFLKNPVYIVLVVVFVLSSLLSVYFLQRKALKSQIALVIYPYPVKINFNFDPAQKEICSINLKKLNLSRFKALEFAVKKTEFSDNISLRIEFTNSFNENSEAYIKGVTNKWQMHRIKFSEFRNIKDWSDMTNLSFIVEQWNVQKKKGVVYIDNVRLVR